jgi:hypothetical protein
MMEESLETIATFFFFAFLDEAVATENALKTAAQFKARLQKRPGATGHEMQSLVVHLTNNAYQSHRKNLAKGHSLLSGEGGWLVPEGVDLSSWKQFHKEAPDNEMLVVLWSQVLGLPDQAISEGIGVTVGTVRYRVGHALQKLGAIHRFKTQAV